jgi:hypothetical protein
MDANTLPLISRIGALTPAASFIRSSKLVAYPNFLIFAISFLSASGSVIDPGAAFSNFSVFK